MKLSPNNIKILTIGATVVVAAVIGYSLGVHRSSKERDMLRSKIDELEQVANEAVVVKRISQQMEDIAFQQKAVSDSERDKAEEQSQIAIQMRDKAEQESRAAYAAEQKALLFAKQAEQSAKEAQAQHSQALESQRIAEMERDAATLAKNISDTLSMISLCQTLSSSAIYNYNNGNYDLALLQAYSSWYFKEKYKGSDALCFDALCICSENEKSTRMDSRAAVTGICTIDTTIHVAVTDYGEIEYLTNYEGGKKTLFHNSEYNFKDVYTSEGLIFALSLHGVLCIVEPGGKVSELSLPNGSYRHIVKYDDKTAILAGDRIIVLFDTEERSIISSFNVSDDITSLFVRNGAINLFMKNGTSAEMDRNGNIAFKELIKDEIITFVHYDSKKDIAYLGCDDGHILVTDMSDGHTAILKGQSGRICNIGKIGSVLYSCSYGKSMHLWNLEELKANNNTELLNSANQQFNSWPLSSAQLSDTEIIVGFSDGTIRRIDASSSSMAALIRKKMTRNFTEEEWRRYIGNMAPYTKFI